MCSFYDLNLFTSSVVRKTGGVSEVFIHTIRGIIDVGGVKALVVNLCITTLVYKSWNISKLCMKRYFNSF